MKPFNAQLFLENLEAAIAFHRAQSDPHGIQNAVLLSLEETKDALANAIKEVRTPIHKQP